MEELVKNFWTPQILYLSWISDGFLYVNNHFIWIIERIWYKIIDKFAMPLPNTYSVLSSQLLTVYGKMGGRPSKSVYGFGPSWTQSKKDNSPWNG